MSAFILEDDTIDLLTTAGLMGIGIDSRLGVYHQGEWHYFSRGEGEDVVGSILKTANYESVNYRYQEQTPCEPYKYNGNGIAPYLGGVVIPWGQVLQSVRCYEYQSCEHPEWEQSLAKAICRAITHKVCQRIASEADSEWVWTREHAEEIMETIKAGLKS